MKVMVVAGARPNFMKVVPILRELERRGVERCFVHTGQHYDARMSDDVLLDLGAPQPDRVLHVGSASHAVQTARLLERFEPVLTAERPDWLVLVGDVNSTLACALVASKLRHALGTRIAHVEAGLRSNDWRMPEEVNRVLTDRLSDLLLTPSPDAAANLAAEGLGAVPTVFVGNVMIDSLHLMLAALKAKPDELSDIPDGRFVLVTMHRPSNVDSVEHLTLLLQTLSDLAERMPVLFPMHPRTRARATEAGLERELRALRVVEPLGYRAMVAAMDRACLVLTDSGGIQEETTVLGVPCVTLRESTERPITVERGTNTLATWPMTLSTLRADIERSLAIGRRGIGECSPDGWDGQAAGRIVSALL